jgi:hypothetical protein
MDERITRRLRDGTLAVVALCGLLDGLRRRERLYTLGSPGAGVIGVLGALAIEVLMLRHPERTRAAWERPSVRATALLGTVVLGRSLVRGRAPRGAAALCWGLVVYLFLLGVVLAGRANPLSALAGSERGGEKFDR